MLPSKKGISLSLEQWEELKKVVADIDKELVATAGVKGSKKVKR